MRPRGRFNTPIGEVKQRRRSLLHRRYFTQDLKIFEGLGTLLEPDKARKELAELP
jgi:hypothetical protein